MDLGYCLCSRFFWRLSRREGFEVYVWRKEGNVGGCPARLWGINNCYYYWYGAFKNACRQEREKRRGERERVTVPYMRKQSMYMSFFLKEKHVHVYNSGARK